MSTTADFLAFHLLTDALETEIVTATLGGNLFGAINSFLLLQFWVFKDISGSKLNTKISKFAIGVVFCSLSNMFLVALFHYWLGWSVWVSRILAAMIAGLLGYLYNKRIVFRQNAQTNVINE
jgi:putative flippase GtrA